MGYYTTDGSNGEDDIDTEGGIFRRTVLIQRAVVERMVQKVVSYIALLP